jgi:hypothetical protein
MDNPSFYLVSLPENLLAPSWFLAPVEYYQPTFGAIHLVHVASYLSLSILISFIIVAYLQLHRIPELAIMQAQIKPAPTLG